jgi:hypothetical protein
MDAAFAVKAPVSAGQLAPYLPIAIPPAQIPKTTSQCRLRAGRSVIQLMACSCQNARACTLHNDWHCSLLHLESKKYCKLQPRNQRGQCWSWNLGRAWKATIRERGTLTDPTEEQSDGCAYFSFAMASRLECMQKSTAS